MADNPNATKTCPRCLGAGVVPDHSKDKIENKGMPNEKWVLGEKTCPTCNGAGSVPK